ncbi:phosphotransferase family protein [Amycolatopsis suaedae]|uniref:Aminoglycoside phosphotransferase family protein n=1 Tax=Amycolatopsis suaedae TaxID=2510978 RepID=A0A4Q7J019_9PSEU|nr:aminoglycoside phosphotransferase family protein [Amycolatopsis suaedae]RZQ60117.1 aminoglycoside phosphotransferase family protein [Amycolatopsis suaedae]
MAERVAREVLAEHGVDLGETERGRGWTNATWLARDLVVRVAREPGPADLLRERGIVALLPPEVGYPEVVDAGVRHGHEWVLTRRVRGENLEEVWPTLGDEARRAAVEQMWERVRHVHRVGTAAAAPHARSRSPFFPDDPAEATATLARLVRGGALTAAHADGLGRVLDRFWAALPDAEPVLNHGDFCTPNTLWRDGEVLALLDFEFAVIAPVAVDLNELVKIAYGPGDRAAMRPAVDPIVKSTVDEAGGPDVLIGYSVLLEAWLLEQELTAEEPDEEGRADATAMLTAFAEGDGGYFAPVVN